MKGVPRARVISADSRPQGPNTVCLGHDAPGTSPEQQYALAELPGTAGSLAGGDTAPAGLLQRLAEAVMKTAGAGETEHVAAALGLAPGHDLLPVDVAVARRTIRGRGMAGGIWGIVR